MKKTSRGYVQSKKKCSECGVRKSLSEFSFIVATETRVNDCKSCRMVKDNKRKLRKNPDEAIKIPLQRKWDAEK